MDFEVTLWISQSWLGRTLVGHLYAGRLTNDGKSMLFDMTKTLAKPRNILLTLKKRNENNVTMIK